MSSDGCILYFSNALTFSNSIFSHLISLHLFLSHPPLSSLSVSLTHSSLSLSLSLGSVVLCQPKAEEGHAFKGVPLGMNLVVVEGGPKGIKKFVSLMLKRFGYHSDHISGLIFIMI